IAEISSYQYNDLPKNRVNIEIMIIMANALKISTEISVKILFVRLKSASIKTYPRFLFT
ncbi:hypothetical protein AAUPMC_17080, partial [Pasteurella multocida subsp. multocida str. Anand1_cattle]